MELFPNTVISRGAQLPVSFFQHGDSMFMRYGEDMVLQADKFMLLHALEDSIMLIKRVWNDKVQHIFVGSTVYLMPQCFDASEIASLSWIPNSRKLLVLSNRPYGKTSSIIDLTALVSPPESI